MWSCFCQDYHLAKLKTVLVERWLPRAPVCSSLIRSKTKNVLWHSSKYFRKGHENYSTAQMYYGKRQWDTSTSIHKRHHLWCHHQWGADWGWYWVGWVPCCPTQTIWTEHGSTCKNKNTLSLNYGWNVPHSSRCRSLRGDPTTTGHTSVRRLEVLWIDPAVKRK